MDLVYFVLVAYGLTQIIVYGSIFNKVRPSKESFRGLGELFHCPLCMGFHVGWFLWALNGFTSLFTFDYNAMTGFALACLSSGTSYVFNMVFGDKGVKYERFISND